VDERDQIRQQIEDLQRTCGFDEDEALAYWHLSHGGTLLLEPCEAHRRPERARVGSKVLGARNND
jgi:hypothetical protein